jgi:hypothetical protein
VNAESPGEYIALVVRLEADSNGIWHISVDGTTVIQALPLMPLALVIRLWRSGTTEILRGNVRLLESDQWVPIQTNTLLEQLIQTWLLQGPGLGRNEGGAPAASQ